MFVFIDVSKKIMSLFKVLLALAIMVILAVQMLGAIEDAVDYYQRWLNRESPHGNPMKVFREVDHPVVDGESHILKKIMKPGKTAGDPVE